MGDRFLFGVSAFKNRLTQGFFEGVGLEIRLLWPRYAIALRRAGLQELSHVPGSRLARRHSRRSVQVYRTTPRVGVLILAQWHENSSGVQQQAY